MKSKLLINLLTMSLVILGLQSKGEAHSISVAEATEAVIVAMTEVSGPVFGIFDTLPRRTQALAKSLNNQLDCGITDVEIRDLRQRDGQWNERCSTNCGNVSDLIEFTFNKCNKNY